MAKFVFQEAVFGDNRSYTLTYYTWLCQELVKAHWLFVRDYHQWGPKRPTNLRQLELKLEALRQDSYDDYSPIGEAKLLGELTAIREEFLSEDFTNGFKGKPHVRVKFQAYVDDLTARIKRDSEGVTWVSHLVQRHFHAFAVRPLAQFTMAAISYADNDRSAPIRENLFHGLAELRDRAFREPSPERVERYLKKVELLRGTAPYKRLRYIANQTTNRDYSNSIQELEDEISVAILWQEHTGENGS